MKKTLFAIALTVPFAFAAQTANPPAQAGKTASNSSSASSTAAPAAKKHHKKSNSKATPKSNNGTGSSVQK